jgi:hypothetical protein
MPGRAMIFAVVATRLAPWEPTRPLGRFRRSSSTCDEAPREELSREKCYTPEGGKRRAVAQVSICRVFDSLGASLCDERPDDRDEFNGHFHHGVRGCLIRRFVLGDRFLVGLRLVALKNAPNALLVQPSGYFDCFISRRWLELLRPRKHRPADRARSCRRRVRCRDPWRKRTMVSAADPVCAPRSTESATAALLAFEVRT